MQMVTGGSVVIRFRPGADPERQSWQAEKASASFFLLPFSLRPSDLQSRSRYSHGGHSRRRLRIELQTGAREGHVACAEVVFLTSFS